MSSVLAETNYRSAKYKEFFDTKERDVLLYGGAGSGKSYAASEKIILRAIITEQERKVPFNAMVVRKSLPSMKRTCEPLLAAASKKFGLSYHLNSHSMISSIGAQSKIYYVSANNKEDYEKIKSITDIDMIWLEEPTEISESVYSEVIKLRLRGGKSSYAQRVFTFNPISTVNWLYQYHFVHDYDNSQKLQVCIDDNIYKDDEYEKELDKLKSQNENLWRVYRLGEWGQLADTIYSGYTIGAEAEKCNQVFYGMDFGFNNPTTLIQVKEIDGALYIKEMLYRTKLTNDELIQEMKTMNLGHDTIYCDSAEPARIQSLFNAGFNAKSAEKSVKDGITFLQCQELHICETSENLVKEIQSYSWKKDKDGQKIDEPVKWGDHTMDAMRYAIYTHMRRHATGPSVASGYTVKTEWIS